VEALLQGSGRAFFLGARQRAGGAVGQTGLEHRPVYVEGKEVGRFNSVWRLEGPNTWRIVFDKGEAVCGAKP